MEVTEAWTNSIYKRQFAGIMRNDSRLLSSPARRMSWRRDSLDVEFMRTQTQPLRLLDTHGTDLNNNYSATNKRSDNLDN